MPALQRLRRVDAAGQVLVGNGEMNPQTKFATVFRIVYPRGRREIGE